MGQGFQLRETASFLNGLPPEVFGKFFRPENSSHFLPGIAVGSIRPVLWIRDYPGSAILILIHPGSRIPDPTTAAKEEGGKIFFSPTIFCSHRYKKKL
jgi:hypothetical protein